MPFGIVVQLDYLKTIMEDHEASIIWTLYVRKDFSLLFIRWEYLANKNIEPMKPFTAKAYKNAEE